MCQKWVLQEAFHIRNGQTDCSRLPHPVALSIRGAFNCRGTGKGPIAAALKPEKPSHARIFAGNVLQRKFLSKSLILPSVLQLVHFVQDFSFLMPSYRAVSDGV